MFGLLVVRVRAQVRTLVPHLLTHFYLLHAEEFLLTCVSAGDSCATCGQGL